MRKLPVPTLIVAALLVVILVTWAVTYQISYAQVGVKFRLGKAVREVTEPGLYMQAPWPFESVKKYDRRLHVLDTNESEVKTSDAKNVIVGCYALWRIKDPLRFYDRARTVAEAADKLRSRINSVRGEVIGTHAMSDFVNLDEEELNQTYNQIEQNMLEGVAKGALEDFGIEVTRVALRRISLPEQVTQNVFAQMISERNRLATTYREEGKSRANKITSEADAAAKKILAFANARAGAIRAEGIRAATRELEKIRAQDSDFFIWLRQMDALEASLARQATIFFDASGELFRSFTQEPLVSPNTADEQPAAEGRTRAPRGSGPEGAGSDESDAPTGAAADEN